MVEPSKIASLEGDEARLYFCLHGECSDNLSEIAQRLKINYDMAQHMIGKLKKMGILAQVHENGKSHYYFAHDSE